MIPFTYYSIWFMPCGKIYAELSERISLLGDSFATPVFQPHVTLLGNLNGSEQALIAQTQRLAARIPPFQVTLTTVDHLDEYFRCLFFRVEETPALLEANREARRLFHQEHEPKFMPHLSLLYGNLDTQTKKQIIPSIGHELNQPFSVSQLHLFSTTGEPEDWYRVQNFELQGS